MPLSDEEAQAAFDFLSRALRQAGYFWVITQVEEKLALGKVHTRKLGGRAQEADEALHYSVPSEGASTRKGTALFAVSESYTPVERLQVLVDATDYAIPAVVRVAATCLQQLHEFGVTTAISFAPEAEVSDEFTLSAAAVDARTAASDRLSGFLNELRAELRHAN